MGNVGSIVFWILTQTRASTASIFLSSICHFGVPELHGSATLNR